MSLLGAAAAAPPEALCCRGDRATGRGVQAQAPNAPYVDLWTPPERFHLDELARLIIEWRAVCIALLRNTIHLVTARNCLALRPLVQPVFDRHLLNANRTHRTLSKRIDRAAPS
jgi:hypothetical protein